MEQISLENIKDIFTILAILAAGIWTFYRFGITREKHPKLQFDLDLNVLGRTEKDYIVQLVAIVENKGLTRQYIDDFKFNVLCFNDDMPVDISDDKINYQLKFEPKYMKTDWFLSKHQHFVDGGITHKFRYVTVLPRETSYAMIYSKLYDKKKGFPKKVGDRYYIMKTFNLKTAVVS